MKLLNHAALRAQWFPVFLAAACATLLALLLFIGVQRAARLQSASSALQTAAGLASAPQLERSGLTLVQRGLETRTYVGDSLHAIATSRAAADEAFVQLGTAMQAAGLGAGSEAGRLRASAEEHWQVLQRGLVSLEKESRNDLYVDSASGSLLAPAGQRLKREVDMLLAAQARNAAALGNELSQLAALLRQNVVSAGTTLRALLLAGAGLATLLLASMLHFALRAARAARAAAQAEQQVNDLLGTVREGLFLVGRDGRLGEAHSRSLRTLLRTERPAGQSFEELLRPLVDARTLQAATRFLGLLWKDKINDELIESVNPLNPIAVSFARAGGGTELRHLSFTFRRIRGSGVERDYLFGVVADVTDHILLQEELERFKTDSEARAAQLLHMLQVEPVQLQSFLGTVDATVRRCNALLRVPGHEHGELVNKVQGVFREMHSLKGEASALGLGTFTQRAHAIEELLSVLRASPNLAGNDFVPLVVKLGELLTHGQELGVLRDRMALAQAATSADGNVAAAAPDHEAILAQRLAESARQKQLAESALATARLAHAASAPPAAMAAEPEPAPAMPAAAAPALAAPALAAPVLAAPAPQAPQAHPFQPTEPLPRAAAPEDAWMVAGKAPVAARPGYTAPEAPRMSAPAESPAALAALLQQLAREVATSCGRGVHLRAEGLDQVPATHAARVREICVQMVRNSIVHGIEPAAERIALGKSPDGNLRVRFTVAVEEDYSLLFEDDGRGLDVEAIRDQALQRGLIDPDQAASLERSGAYRLLFHAGFSTAEEITEHAGRGVGLDVVNAAVRALGGRIGIASMPGRFTRFKLSLPRALPAANDQASAA
jgi:HPt (histidine-containing phosphotransfer) domain-containing protein/two-component sensor histidine kinase/PAS domain-containing protein